MVATRQEIVEAAMKLPLEDRAAIVERLLETLSTVTEEIDDSWGAELDRRLSEFEQSEDGAMPWEMLKNQE